jgi:type IV pilus assembly protein PilN
MIRINLLAAERTTKKKAVAFQAGQKLVLACSTILVLALAFIGWRFLTLSRESAKLDSDIAAAQQETVRLHSIIQQVQQFEQRKAQLQQRVTLIEQLRKGQTGPVHMLDQVSKSLPPMLWLTSLKQANAEIQIDGKATTLTGLSEFVSNLEASGYFKRSIEIVSTQVDPTAQAPGGELIRFTIKAQFQTPEAAKTPASAARTGG